MGVGVGVGRRKVVAVDLGDGVGGHVRVMSGRELAAFRERVAAFEAATDRDIRAAELLVAMTASDAAGNRLVPDGQEGVVEDWPHDHLTALFHVAAELNGITSKKG